VIGHGPTTPGYGRGAKREWFAASGRGEFYWLLAAYEPFLPAFRELLPHIMVLVQLEEGPRLVGYMVNCTPEQMTFGMKVRVVFKPLTDTVTLPVWEPAGRSERP